MSGKFPGVNVSQNTGAPGGINVDRLGTSTIEGMTQPLYVVDGVIIINNAANQSGIDLVTAATGAGSPNPQG